MNCQEAEALITGLVDNELSELERSFIQSHLKDCPGCRSAYEEERALKREIRKVGADVIVPAELERKVLSDQHIFLEETESSEGRHRLVRLFELFRRPAFSFAFLAIVVLAIWSVKQPASEPISLAALQIQHKIMSGDLALQKARNQEELNHWLSSAVDGRFGPMVYDFSSMNVIPLGGIVREINGRKVLIAVFRGTSVYVSCFTFVGTEEDAPKDASVFFDSDKKMNFYTFSSNGIQAVLHREGNVICILVSNVPTETLLSLVKNSSPHNPTHTRQPS